MSKASRPLVSIRTPTYRRPDALRRCLQSMRDQTWANWVCDVFDDDPDGSARAVCRELADPRIRYHRNDPQRYASRNIDKCFSRADPHGAAYFCVVEDDNLILKDFIEDNVAISRRHGVELVFRNQFVEFASGTPQARLSEFGILDRMFHEGIYQPEIFRLSLLPGIGISNGGVFWSARSKSPLEIAYECTATLQEYMRTFSVVEPIYVAMEPKAVWAENGEQTTRDLGGKATWLRRELDLKRAVQLLQREAWKLAPKDARRGFLHSDAFAYDKRLRAAGMVKSLISLDVGGLLSLRQKAELALRGLLIATAGRPTDEFRTFVAARKRLIAELSDGGGIPAMADAGDQLYSDEPPKLTRSAAR